MDPVVQTCWPVSDSSERILCCSEHEGARHSRSHAIRAGLLAS